MCSTLFCTFFRRCFARPQRETSRNFLVTRSIEEMSYLFTFHLNCKYNPWGLINDTQMSIYNRKHWHALSHSLHFVRHEGRLATIGRTRLTRSMAANELGFLYTHCGTCSSSYGDVFRKASPMVIGTGPPTCAQDDGGTQAKVLCFLISVTRVTLFGRFSFLQVYGVVEVFFYEVSVCILFASCDSQSINIVCPRKLN